jgi:hypothetical protein
MGKTSLVLNMAEHAAIKHGQTVGFFSLEMSRESLFIRLLTSVAQIDAHKLQTGHVGQRDYDRLSNAISQLGEAPIYIDDSPGVGVLEMRAKSRRLASERGLSMIVVDYLQLMSGRGRFDNRTLELASISRGLKGLAKELNVPVIALSQLSRAPEARSDHRPLLSDLRESGALEQDADVVMMIYRPEMYPDCKEEDKGIAELIIAKQRNGPTGTINLAFLREHTRFQNLSAGRSNAWSDRPSPTSIWRPLRTTSAPSSRSWPPSAATTGAVPRASSRSSRRTRTGMAPSPWRSRSSARARRCWRARTSRRQSSCVERGCARRFLVFGALGVSDVSGVVDYDLTPTISTPSAGKALQELAARRGSRLRYHLKIDTGMNRLGLRYDNLPRTLPDLLGSPNLELVGLYTHFATADMPSTR